MVDATLEGTTYAGGEFKYHLKFSVDTGKFENLYP